MNMSPNIEKNFHKMTYEKNIFYLKNYWKNLFNTI